MFVLAVSYGTAGNGVAKPTAKPMPVVPREVLIAVNPLQPSHAVRVTENTDPVMTLARGEDAYVVFIDDHDDRASAPVHIAGPYDGRLSDARARLEEAGSPTAQFVGLLAAEARLSHQQLTGAIPSRAALPADLGLLDIRLGGPARQCYATVPLRLWREAGGAAETIVLSYIGGGAGKVHFDAGESMATWPVAVDVAGGAPDRSMGPYVVSHPEGAVASYSFTLTPIRFDDQADPDLRDLLDNGCLDQARTVARQWLEKSQWERVEDAKVPKPRKPKH